MDFLNDVYDILAQNIGHRGYGGQEVRDEITELIDCLDTEREAIVFKRPDGREFELRLVHTYAPRSK